MNNVTDLQAPCCVRVRVRVVRVRVRVRVIG